MRTRTREAALIRRARAGDGSAMEELIRHHQASLYAFMLRMSGSPHTAEDVVQEAFVRVLRNLDRFDDRFRFSTWLFTIAKRLYVNAAQKRRPAFDTDSIQAHCDGREAPPSITAARESREHVRDVLDAALAALNEQQREIILLFHQQNWSITDIALHLEMPEGTVKSHLHRARLRMRKTITENRSLRDRALEVWT